MPVILARPAVSCVRRPVIVKAMTTYRTTWPVRLFTFCFALAAAACGGSEEGADPPGTELPPAMPPARPGGPPPVVPIPPVAERPEYLAIGDSIAFGYN